jgi:thioredoxin reductase (NADPH)
MRCDGHHVLNKNIAIFGHDTSAAWVGIILFERYQCPEITILTNGEAVAFNEEVLGLMKKYNIKVVTEEITSIIGEPKNKILSGFVCGEKTVNVEFAFISLGMIVYNELAKKLNANLDQRGFVLTDAKGKTSVEGLYVAGDLRANAKKQIYTAWDQAVDSADEINLLIRRKKRLEF